MPLAGSHDGDTRIIRLAYMEHPDYVPLLRRSYDLWAELEKERGEKLYHECGLLQVGPQGGHVIQGVLASAREHEHGQQNESSRIPKFGTGSIERRTTAFRNKKEF